MVSKIFNAVIAPAVEDEKTLLALNPSEDAAKVYGEKLIGQVRKGNASAVLLLILNGADVNARDSEGMTALHHAAAIRARACIRVLVGSDQCDYLIKDLKGRYASDLAGEWGNDYAVERLLENKQIKQAHHQNVPAWTPGPGAPVPN